MMQIDPEEIKKMTLGYEERIKRQSESIGRLLHDPDATAEIVRLNDMLAQSQSKVTELEAYIARSASSDLQIVTKEAIPDDPAETKQDEAGPSVDWTPPVDIYRPVKSLPSL